MRKFLIPIIGAASVLVIATPATAQYQRGYNQPGYNQPGNGYGYGYRGGNFSRRLQERVQRIRVDIRQLEERRIISYREARSLEGQAADLQRSVYRDSGNGIQPGEAQRIEERIRRLEYRIQRESSDLNNRPDRRRY